MNTEEPHSDPVANVDAGQASPLLSPEHAPGELRIPGDLRSFSGTPNGARRSVGIAVSRFNGDVTSLLLEGAIEGLESAGVARGAIDILPVPGAFEIPLAAMALARTKRYGCVLAIGCVIRGETPHFDYISSEAASGVQVAGLETGVPVAFGVLTCNSLEQAMARAGGPQGNKGRETALGGLEMADALARLRAGVNAR